MEAVLEKLKDCKELPALPAVAMEIMSRCQSPDADIDKLSELIGMDPALAAKILKTANSSLFPGSAGITGLRRAVVRLGLKMTRMVVLSFGLVSSSFKKAPRSFDFQHFWKHALTTGNAAKFLCEELRLRERGEAFAIGLLQDLGVLGLHFALPGEYEKVLIEKTNSPVEDLCNIEKRLMGITHLDVGAYLLEQWGLPSSVCVPIGHHDRPEEIEDPAALRMARVLNIGSYIGKLFLEPAKGISQQKIFKLGERYFDLSPERLGAVLERVESNVRAMADLFSVDTDSMPSYDEVSRLAAAELGELALAAEAERMHLSDSQEQARQKVQELERRNLTLKERAVLDGLTRVFNRAHVEGRIREEFARARRYQRQMAMVMVDIDDFKRINDVLGHQAGDAVLKEMAAFFRSALRGTDLVGRYGGDEFMVVLIEPTREAVLQVAERLRLGVAARSGDWMISGETITISVGAVFVADLGNVASCDELLETVDKCLYEAKHAGKNCTRYSVI